MVLADYYDGRSSRRRHVQLSLDGADLRIASDDFERREYFWEVAVSEHLGSAPRMLRFTDGAFCEVRDQTGLDLLLEKAGYRRGRVERAQRALPQVLGALLATILLGVAGYVWGLPIAAQFAAQRVPDWAAQQLGVQTLKVLDGGLLAPSKIDSARQSRIQARFAGLRMPDRPATLHVVFRDAPLLGENAFTLPDGCVVVLDPLVKLLDDDEIIAVLAHEAGHASRRDPLKVLIAGSAVAGFWTFYVGDISGLLAAAPASVLHAQYKQSVESQADDYAAEVLLRNSMSPELLADALEKIAAARNNETVSQFGQYLSSHPATQERETRLRKAAEHSPASRNS